MEFAPIPGSASSATSPFFRLNLAASEPPLEVWYEASRLLRLLPFSTSARRTSRTAPPSWL